MELLALAGLALLLTSRRGAAGGNSSGGGSTSNALAPPTPREPESNPVLTIARGLDRVLGGDGKGTTVVVALGALAVETAAVGLFAAGYIGAMSLGIVTVVVAALLIAVWTLVRILEMEARVGRGQSLALEEYQEAWRAFHDGQFEPMRTDIEKAIGRRPTDAEVERCLVPFTDGYMRHEQALKYRSYVMEVADPMLRELFQKGDSWGVYWGFGSLDTFNPVWKWDNADEQRYFLKWALERGLFIGAWTEEGKLLPGSEAPYSYWWDGEYLQRAEVHASEVIGPGEASWFDPRSWELKTKSVSLWAHYARMDAAGKRAANLVAITRWMRRNGIVGLSEDAPEHSKDALHRHLNRGARLLYFEGSIRGRLQVHDGHSLWEWDWIAKELRPAVVEAPAVQELPAGDVAQTQAALTSEPQRAPEPLDVAPPAPAVVVPALAAPPPQLAPLVEAAPSSPQPPETDPGPVFFIQAPSLPRRRLVR